MEELALRERKHDDTCPFCHDLIVAGQEAWPCDKCGTRLHAECFHDNHDACTVLGCTGRARAPRSHSERGHEPRFSLDARAERERLRHERRVRVDQRRRGIDVSPPVAHYLRPERRPWPVPGIGVAVTLAVPFIAIVVDHYVRLSDVAIACTFLGWIVFATAFGVWLLGRAVRP